MNKWSKYKQIFTRLLERFASYDAFPFARLTMLFGISILLLLLYSYKENTVKVFNTEIKQAPTKEVFSPSVLPEGILATTARRGEDATVAMDSAKQRFLLIGDSMLEGFGHRLNDYCRQNGHTMNSVIWYSSSTLWYGNCDTISYFIKKMDPTYVILVLGANELFIKDVFKRDALVKNILKQIGGRKYLWVGPPNWKDDTGINNLIVKNTGYKCYFPSKDLKFKRLRDGAHPTSESAGVWMDSVALFIMNESKYPVLLSFPSDSIKRKNPPTTLLQPNPPPNL